MYAQQQLPYQDNTVSVKKYFGSGKVLTLGILYMISAVLSLITLVTENSSVSYTYYIVLSLFDEMGASVPSDVYRSLNSSAIAAAVSSTLITVLIAVAFIVIFATSRSSSPTTTPFGGLTILFVLAMISFISAIVLVAVCAAIYLIAAIGVSSSLSNSSSRSNAATGFIVGGVFLSLCAFVYIFYNACCKNFYRSARLSLRSGKLYNRGAIAYGVFCIIFAVGSVFSFISLFTLDDLFYKSTHSSARHFVFSDGFITLSAVSTLLQILILIFTAILAIGYGSYINKQKYNRNNPGGGTPYYNRYAQPPYPNAPQNYPQYPSQPSAGYPDPYANRPAPPQDNAPYNPYQPGAPYSGQNPATNGDANTYQPNNQNPYSNQ